MKTILKYILDADKPIYENGKARIIKNGEIFSKDIGWLHLHAPQPIEDEESLKKFARGIEYLGIEHLNPVPPDIKKYMKQK